ncbi:hypothetical protein [Minwuia sp.]|uniref:hypothetical protein n=1 Tax=Minwuia sp. TaxID=2493630 RepID=UPI003A95A4F4
MLIASVENQTGNNHAPIRFGVIGTCRVHNPMRSLIDQGRAEMIWREFNAFTHGPMEALQYLRFARGDVQVPDPFAPFIFRTDRAPDVESRLADIMKTLDFLIVEISSFARLRCGMYEFQQNYFSENFVRKGGVDFLSWWRDVTQRKDTVSETADELIGKRRDDLKPSDEEIIRTLTFEELADDVFVAGIRKVADYSGLPIILVPHFSFDDEDNAISNQRTRNRRLVEQVASETGHACFDPSPHLMAYGRKKALKNEGRDLYHYSPEFDAHIADHLYEKIAEVASAEHKPSAAAV